MAEFYAIKHPEGEVSDFSHSERAAINRFLRRQDNWDSLWIDWLSQGYEISPVNLPKEEAIRLNREMDYYRDSTRPVSLRERDPLPWVSSFEQRVEPALSVPESFQQPVSAESQPKASEMEADVEHSVNYIDEFDEVSPIRIVSKNEILSCEGPSAIDDTPHAVDGGVDEGFSLRADPEDRIGSEEIVSLEVEPVDAFEIDSQTVEEHKEIQDKNGYLSISAFLSRNAGKTEAPKVDKRDRDVDLMRPQFIATENDDDYLKARAASKEEKTITPVVDLADYEISVSEDLGDDAPIWHDDRKVAFNAAEDDLASVPRVREEARAPERVLIDDLQDFPDDAGVAPSDSAQERFGDLVGEKDQVRVRPAIAGRRSVALPTKGARKYTLADD